MERENLISGLGTYLWETHVGVSSLRVLPSPVDELCIIVHGIGMQDVGEQPVWSTHARRWLKGSKWDLGSSFWEQF